MALTYARAVEPSTEPTATESAPAEPALPSKPTPLSGLERAHAVLAIAPLGWALFHLVEQWSLFRGRLAWLAQMRATSGTFATSLEVALAVLPIVAWAGLHLRALVLRKALPGQTVKDEGALARGLGAVQPLASSLALLFLGWHVIWLWVPKLLGAAPIEAYDAMQRTLGLPWALGLHAFGLAAVLWHLATALPDGLTAMGLVRTDEGRRGARTVGVAIGLALFVLFAQMVGWIGTGVGTFWPIQVVDPS